LTLRGTKTAPDWLSYLDLACVALVCALWYALPQAGPWLLVLALLPWGLRLALTGHLVQTTAFDLPLALFLLLAGLAVWTAYDRQAAGAKFWLIVGAVLLYYALVNARALGRRLAWLLSLLGAGLAVYFLLTHDWSAAAPKFESLARLGQVLQAPLPDLPVPSLHANVTGGILAALLPFGLLSSHLALERARDHKGRSAFGRLSLLLALALCAIMATGLLLSSSRGAWLSLGTALLLAAVIWAAQSVSRRLTRQPAAAHAGMQRWVVPVLGIGLLIAALALVLAWPDEIWAALRNLPGPDTATPRAALHRNSLILAHDYALLGAGLDNYKMLYSTYALLVHVGHSLYSHNLLLDVAIQQGLPSVFVLVVAWTLFVVAVWRGLWRPSQERGASHHETRCSEELGLLVAAGLSLVVTLTHGLGDDIYYSGGAVLLLFVPLAFAAPFLAAPGYSGDEGVSRRWLVVLPVGLGLAILLALVWRRPLLSLVFSNLGAVHQSQAELSVYEWPAWPIQDALRREIDLGRPVAEYERALALDPGNASANRRLGQIELSLGEYADALGHLERAYAAESWSPTTRLLYGEALIVNGRLDEGQALWAGLSPGEGQFRGRAFWYRYIGDGQRAAWIEQAAGSR